MSSSSSSSIRRCRRRKQNALPLTVVVVIVAVVVNVFGLLIPTTHSLLTHDTSNLVLSREAHASLGTVASRTFANHRNKQAAQTLISHLEKSAIYDALVGGQQTRNGEKKMADAIDTTNANKWADFVLNALLTNSSKVRNGSCGQLKKPPPNRRKGTGVAVVTYGLGDADNEWESIPAAINAMYATLHGYDFIRLTPYCDAGMAASTPLALQEIAQRHGRSLPLEITSRDDMLAFLWDHTIEKRNKMWGALLGLQLALEHYEYVFFLSRSSYVAQLASPLEPLTKHLGVGKLVLAPESVLRINPRAHLPSDRSLVFTPGGARASSSKARRRGKGGRRGLLALADGSMPRRVGGSALLFRASEATKELVNAWWDAPLQPTTTLDVEGRWSDMAKKYASLQAATVIDPKEQNLDGKLGTRWAYDNAAQGEGNRARPRCDTGFLVHDPFYEGCLAAVLEHPRYSGRATLLDDRRGEGLFGGERGLFVRRSEADPASRVFAAPPPPPYEVEMEPLRIAPPPPRGVVNDATPDRILNVASPPHPPRPPSPWAVRQRRRRERLKRIGYNATEEGWEEEEEIEEEEEEEIGPARALPPPPPPPRSPMAHLDRNVKNRIDAQVKAREVMDHVFFCTLKNFVRPPPFSQTCYFDSSPGGVLPAVFG
ncbi:hypothetical protein NFJ02_29g67520 [Pycnococcus provasolii]